MSRRLLRGFVAGLRTDCGCEIEIGVAIGLAGALALAIATITAPFLTIRGTQNNFFQTFFPHAYNDLRRDRPQNY